MKSINLLVWSLVAVTPNIEAQEFAAPQINQFSLTQQGNRSSPAFADIDQDDDLDLFTGLVSGDFGFFENIGAADFPVFGIFTIAPFNIGSIGGNATPFLVDLDNDGDFDLFAGGDGGLRYYENLGNVSIPAYGPEIQNPYSIISPTGISKPYLVDIDNDNDMDLFVGSSDGNTYYYENTGTVGNPAFAMSVSNPFGLMNVGQRSAPALADMDNDGDFDALIGNSQGNMHYFENNGTIDAPVFASVGQNPFNLLSVGDDAKPFFGDLDDDGDLDLMVGNALGDYYYFEKVSSTKVDEKLYYENVLIYPNPSTDYIIIQFKGLVDRDWNLIVTDLNGKVVLRERSISDGKIFISNDIGRGIFLSYIENTESRQFTGTLLME